MEATPLDKNFWNSRWEHNETGWDIGYASPAITSFLENYPNKEAAILIPGCGNAYEAEWLFNQGFTNITLIDIAPLLVQSLQEKFKATPSIKVICTDFFQHNNTYDLIVEQTFFCAISPSLRKEYVTKMHSMLNTNGEIIGLLFNKEFEKQGPPFGGTITEYQLLFSPYFTIQKMEDCYNSIPPRAGSEAFIHLKK